AAVHLTVRGAGVERAADVVRGDNLAHLDLARLRLDVDDHRLTRRGVRGGDVPLEVLVEHHRRRVVEGLGDEDAPSVPEVSRPHHLLVRKPPVRLAPHEHDAARDVEPLRRLLELYGGELEELRLHLLGGESRGVAGDERCPARVRPHVPRPHARVGVDHVTRSSGTPSVSATIIARTVSDPWPISLAPVSSATLPKSSSLTIAPQPSER